MLSASAAARSPLSMKEVAAVLGGKSAKMMAPAHVKRQTGNRVESVSPFRRKRRLPTIIETEVRALRICQRQAVGVGASA